MGRNRMKKKLHSNSFSLLWEAVLASRRSMWSSLQVLIALTFVLATIFFIAEYNTQKPEYDYVESLVWAFTRYINDPGEFSSITPTTLTGRWMATLIGIVGILIFAVPAGLIGSAFTSAIENEQHKNHLREIGDRLVKAFRRKQEPKTMYKCVPRYISIGTLQALKNMTENDIVEAVEFNPRFRLRNLATATAKDVKAIDHLVVEMFPLNTIYGTCIDRSSDITIVCPTAISEASIGNFSYYLALIGGFNYISKEVELNVDEPTSYYIMPEEDTNEQVVAYRSDLLRLSSGKNRWTIFLISSESRKDTALHFVTAANANTGRNSTIIDHDAFERLWDGITTEVVEETGVRSDLNELRPAGPKNAAVRIGGGVDTNAFTIRISSELLVWDSRYMALAKSLAEILALRISDTSGEKITDVAILKQSGLDYQK